MKLTSPFVALSFLAVPAVCSEFFLQSSFTLGKEIESTKGLKSYFRDDNRRCQVGLYALISGDFEKHALESYFKDNSEYETNALSESRGKPLEDTFNKVAAACGGTVQALESDTVFQVNENMGDSLFYKVEGFTTEKLTQQLRELSRSAVPFVLLIENLHDSSSESAPSGTPGNTKGDPFYSKKKPGRIIPADPFFWWLSNGLIASLLVSLLLITILVVGISWLSSIEGPTGFVDLQSKKQN